MSVKKVNSNNPRVLAVQTLSRVKDGAYSNLQLNQVIKKHQLSAADRSLLTTLVYGVIQHRLTLEFYLAPFINPAKIDPWVRELLYTALFQWQFLDRVPKHALFNESIEVAKIMGHQGTAKYVTAILHKMDREGLPNLQAIDNPTERLVVEYSVPHWLVENLISQVGQSKTLAILKSINLAPKQSIRVNSALSTDDQVVASLEEAGLKVKKSAIVPHAYLVTGGHVATSQAFLKGWIILQDESAMLPVESMQLNSSGQSVLDVAAAPGGKTTQIAAAVGEAGHVLALDIHQHKIKLILDNAQRLGVGNQVSAQMLDARQIPNQLSQQFDRVLVDAPCSGLGLLRRKPEIRYEKTLADVEKLAKLQGEILSASSHIVKKDGIMVYSTCTILQQENSDVVQQFLAQHPNFELLATKTDFNLKSDRQEKTLQIYPDDYLTDGFFIATFQRKE
ncbi:16S rRNA (cytosine(967)-C(5))-methyltransferase RsmB [Convivina praedatoris]|uniref:16S rRNA (cytosine(967)-C(5))-methyltransferase n=1 Tax=Convivina praedatoris TaxID=2880963 RepID=A0ABM9D4P0_9LACO|nr:16S rRNA (cytosine(967)-C(5))-methyltransferase RsmB [Convivina sp. LMG 32447]CAH1854274.1 Ribosomal RNA small subunit methyltransferase B [Convivina sp. LMG 32447]CAH1855499.1 Ribosomal RNA small subunit methyltransferase B [Convivina sp. LMG 32447]CAH1855605.1 Ribosomal RNA small subunit methyltransferase B [Convivina sp. LMG 32447]